MQRAAAADCQCLVKFNAAHDVVFTYKWCSGQLIIRMIRSDIQLWRPHNVFASHSSWGWLLGRFLLEDWLGKLIGGVDRQHMYPCCVADCVAQPQAAKVTVMCTAVLPWLVACLLLSSVLSPRAGKCSVVAATIDDFTQTCQEVC